MKKIMFNDRYGLTKAVLEGRKTMTRRIINSDWLRVWGNKGEVKITYDSEIGCFLAKVGRNDNEPMVLEPTYKIGEVVAVAQRYKDIRDIIGDIQDGKSIKSMAGWNNKMFVRADLMPHQIRITDVRVERLQDISNEDCIKEGIDRVYYGDEVWFRAYNKKDACMCAPTPKKAFAALIDKISGKGTFESNPWVFVYEFELVK